MSNLHPRALMRPAIALMQRLQLPGKFSVVLSLFLAPLVLALVFFDAQLSGQQQRARAALAGLWRRHWCR